MLKTENNKGCLCHQIREETNTKIDLPTENSNSEMIVITGKKSNCEAARDRILAIQRELVREPRPQRLLMSFLLLSGSLGKQTLFLFTFLHVPQVIQLT